MTQEKFSSKKDQELLKQIYDDLLSISEDIKSMSKDIRGDLKSLSKTYDRSFDRLERINKRSWLDVIHAADNLFFHMERESIRQDFAAPPPKEKYRSGIGGLGAVYYEE
jgi:hypothetical protein